MLVLAACLVCVVATAATLVAYRRDVRTVEVASKCVASVCFVSLWLLRADAPSAWLLAALLGCLLGDVLLVVRGRGMFAAGLAAFLVAHICYGAVFVRHAALDKGVLLGSSLVLLAVGAAVYRWLYPRLPAKLRVAVGAYFIALLVMCALAAAAAVPAMKWLWLVGALAFAASDLAVALHRFVNPSGVHRLWGLPVYYAAQLVLAWSLP